MAGRTRRLPRARARLAQHATLAEVETGKRSAGTTARAGIEDRVKALEAQQLPEERRCDHRRRCGRQGAQRADEHAIERVVGLALLRHLVDGLEHRHRVRKTAVVLAERTVGVDGLGLGDHVELAALVALQREMRGGLEAPTESTARPPDALRDGPHLAAALGEDRDDAIGLTELDGTKHDSLIPVQRHIRSVVTSL